MKLNKKLNLVIPIERDDGSTIYVHSMPVERATFEMYFRVMAKAFASIQSLGAAVMSGPKIAEIALRQTAIDAGTWEDRNGVIGVQNGLMGEIRRLTNIILPTANGWQTLPITDAIDAELIDKEDIEEAEGAIVFFILSSAMVPRNVLPGILTATTEWWGSQVTSSNVSGFARSLKQSKPIENSGAKAKASSTPV